jgi:hypothetical protein
MNTLRELCAKAIDKNGGYSTGYHDRFALSFNVGLYHVNMSKEHIYKVMCETHGHEPMPANYQWDEQRQYDWAQETTCYMLNDDDGRRTYGEATGVKYGLPRGEHYFEVKFGLYGRGGKHLCVERFEGHRLDRISAGALAAEIRDHSAGSTTYSNEWCRNLLAMIDEWTEIFTPKNASDEVEYQAAYQMHVELFDLNKENAERLFWAERDTITKGAMHA